MPAAGLSEGIHTLSCQSRHFHDRIACTFIDLMESLKHFCMRLTIKVDLVEHYGHRDIVDLACHKDPVQERKLDLRIIYGGDYECAVQICRDDMRLAGQIRGLADHIVLARMHLGDDSRVLQRDRPVRLECHMVANSNRIGRGAALKSYLSSQHSRKQVPLRQLCQQIVASRVLYYCRLSVYNHQLSLFNGAKIKNFRFYIYLCGI